MALAMLNLNTSPRRIPETYLSHSSVSKACDKVVEALEKRNWKMPGIDVKKMDMSVKTITKENEFGIEFFSWLGRGVSSIRINIPEKELTVYDDGYPIFYTYVGKNWKADQKGFVFGDKIWEKEYEKPQTYLKYEGQWNSKNINLPSVERLPPHLVARKDPREYSPQGDEPLFYETDKVFKVFVDYLENVLKEIEKSKPDEKSLS